MATTSPAPVGHIFSFQNVSYILRPVTQDDRKEYHAIANAHAMQMARATAKYQPPEEAMADIEAARQLVNAGSYWWDEEGGWRYRQTKEGLVRLCWLCMKRQELKSPHDLGKVDVEVIRQMAEVDYGRWLREQYDLANPTPSPAKGEPTGDGSMPGSPSAGDSAGPTSAP